MNDTPDENRIKRMMRLQMVLFVVLVGLTVTSASIGMLKAMAPNTLRIVYGIAAFQVFLVAGILMHLIGSRRNLLALVALTAFFASTMVAILGYAHSGGIIGTEYTNEAAPVVTAHDDAEPAAAEEH